MRTPIISYLPLCSPGLLQIFVVLLVLDSINSPVMHFQSALKILPWLLLPVIAMAANPPLGGSTTIGTGRLSLLTSQNLSTIDIKRAVYCTHGEPYIFTSSLNNTFPKTPPISQSFLASAGFTHNDDTYPFDCFIEVPGGVVVFEVC